METSPWLRAARATRALVVLTVAVAFLGRAWPAAAQEQSSPVTSGVLAGPAEGDPSREPASRAIANWKDYRSPAMAKRLSGWFTVAPLLGGLTLVIAAASSHSSAWARDAAIVGGSSMAFGLTLGPGVGYAYSGQHLRGWGVGVLRLAGLAVGTVAVADAALSGAYCSDSCSHEDKGGTLALGLVLVMVSAISAIHDVVKAPEAAQRSNAEHGLSDLTLAPVVAASGPGAFRGLALAGRF